jgi:small subunit ribosomal protein S2
VLSIGVEELLEAGVHFGHQTRRWNPRMKPFIYGERNGVYIINLAKTLAQLEAACGFLAETVRKGGEVLFVGTKKQAQAAIQESAKATGQLYVAGRWLGGSLTNFNTIKRSIGRLKELEKWDTDGTLNNYGKQEQSALRREMARLVKNLDGIRSMEKPPAAMFVVDIRREHNAVAEARRLKIPIVAMVDTNCDPELVDYPVPANDDAIRSIRLILSVVAQAVTHARGEFEATRVRRLEPVEMAAAPTAAFVRPVAEVGSTPAPVSGAPVTSPAV